MRSKESVAHEGANVEAARQLAHLLDAAGDRTIEEVAAWTRVAELDPFDATASAVIGRQALEARRAAETRRAGSARRWPLAPPIELRRIATSRKATSPSASSTLAKRQVMAALEDAPTYVRAQELLLAIVDGTR